MTTSLASSIGVSVGLSVVWTTAAVNSFQGQPTTEEEIVVCYVDVPSTLDGGTSKAHAIVRARLGDAEVRTRLSPSPVVYTAHTLEIVEVLKGHPRYPIPFEVLRHGGDLVTSNGTKRFVERAFPAFEAGAEYLLFLYWNDYLKTYEPAFGPDAAFRVAPDGRLQALGRGDIGGQHDRLDVGDVSARIRQIAGTGK
jgi:hypothetical protein